MTPDATAPPAGGAPGAVASVLVRDAILGRLRRAPVIASGHWGAYLDVDGDLLAVIGPDAVRVPVAVVVAEAPALASGSTATVGDGTVTVGASTARVTRWFDPQVRVTALSARSVLVLADVLDAHPSPDRLLAHDAPAVLAEALAGGRPGDAIDALMGRGSGLTPTGDDLLAGALAALRAVRDPAADGLGAAIAAADRQTNRLSGALLVAADRAAVVPEAAAVLRALEGRAEVGPAAHALLRVGHTSGWHLAAGLLAGARHHLAVAAPPDPRRR